MQYLSKAYITTLQEHGVEISVAQRGRPWENGYAERLIRTLKEEEVNINDYQSITEARDRIGHFITQVYHQETPTLGVRVFDTYGISTTNLILTLRNCGLISVCTSMNDNTRNKFASYGLEILKRSMLLVLYEGTDSVSEEPPLYPDGRVSQQKRFAKHLA